MVQNPPQGYHTVTPYLLIKGAREFLDFAQDGLGATLEGGVYDDPRNGLVGHTAIRIGDSTIMLADAMDGFEPTHAMIHLYVDDADALHARAVAAGATSTQEPADQFYGDRTASVTDKWGTRWYFATHVEDVSEEQMAKRMQEAMAEPAQS